MEITIYSAPVRKPVVPSKLGNAGGSATANQKIPAVLLPVIQRIASSTKLSTAEKVSFTEAILSAFQSGNGRVIQKVMKAIGMLEAGRKEGTYSSLSLEELSKLLPDKTSKSGVSTPAATVTVPTEASVPELLTTTQLLA